jgi:N-formylglutamate amidohydrolase
MRKGVVNQNSSPREEVVESFSLRQADVRSLPWIFACPHAGRFYPRVLLDAARVSQEVLRRSEDCLMDLVVASAPEHGIDLLQANWARSFVDLNRPPWDLDPSMYSERLPDYARAYNARVAAGLGTIARLAGEGQPIYGRKLTFDEARERIEALHLPYHDCLEHQLSERRSRLGLSLLIDWHSMPAAATRGMGPQGKGFDIVLGDRFGTSCHPGLTSAVEIILRDLGFSVARNTPYAGGYTTSRHGAPTLAGHALQIEISRKLYLNEKTLEPGPEWPGFKAKIDSAIVSLSQFDWQTLIP